MQPRDPEAEAQTARQLEGLLLGERYRLDAFVDHGGFAAVFRATDLRLDTEVAVKIAKPGEDPGLLKRFENEIRIGARLSPERGIAQATDRGTLAHPEHPYDSSPYLVTNFIRGRSLKERIIFHSGRFPFDATIRITHDLLNALEHLHERGVVHRDIKPENIMVRDDGTAVLIDLGLAFATGEGEEPRSPDLTENRLIIGTKRYMSPEQGTGVRPRCSFDIYALGATLYEVLTGSPPFGHVADRSILKKKLTEKIPPVLRMRRSTPPELADALDSMLGTDPDERPTAAELAKRIRDLHSGPAPSFARSEEDEPEEANDVVQPLPNTATPPEATPREPTPQEPSPQESVSELVPSSWPLRLAVIGGTLCLGLFAGLVAIWALPAPGTTAAPIMRSLPSQLGALQPEGLTETPAEPQPEPKVEPIDIEPIDIEPATGPPKPIQDSSAKPPRKTKVRKPTPPPAPEKGKATQPPPPSCAERRGEAKAAANSKQWKDVLASTEKASCWPSKTERTRLRANALMQLGRYAACAQETLGHSSPVLVRLNNECYRKISTEEL
ncbi:MAG: serine/threonine protein kinase [Nannocystales bacterium]